jgi:hypothetical protein
MSVDAKCYECISGAGLEPILDKRYINSKTPFTLAKEYPKDVLKSFQDDPSVPPSMKEKLGVAMGLSGGRGQASGFIMRMMAENKKKHNGQYKNPSDNDYGSTMNKFRAFDYDRLANADQNGNNQSDYGASPFIVKHFGSPEAVPFIPKAQRGSEEHRVIEGETEEQKAARLKAKSEELAQLAKDLLEKSGARSKIKGFLKGKVLVKKAKELLEQKKVQRTEREKLKAEEAKRKAVKETKSALTKEIDDYIRKGGIMEEWRKLNPSGLYDYFSYGSRDPRSALREAFREWRVDAVLRKFPQAAEILKEGWRGLRYNIDEMFPHYIDGTDVARGYSYKKLSYGEAKKVYDAFKQAEEEDEEEVKARQRGLKGVVRRLVRTKKTIKEQAQALKLPKWWNGIMAIIGAAKEGKMDSSENGTVWEYCKNYHDWLGSVLFYLDHKSKESKYFIDVASLPPKVEEPKNWNKAKPEVRAAYNAYVSAKSDASKGVKGAMIKVFALWLQWVFKVAMPQKGWKLIDYKPREEDFPPDIMEKGHWAADAAAIKKAGVGEVPSYLRISLGGTPQPKHDYSERSKIELGPLPEGIPLLIEPEGRFAYLVSGRTSNGMAELVDWDKLAKGIIDNPHSGEFSLSTKFRKMGTHWEYINHRYDPEKHNPMAMRPTYLPVPAGDKVFKDTNDWTLLGTNPSPDSKDRSGRTRHISWAYPEGITQIIEPYFNELCSRKEWDGTPLTKTDLTGAGRRKRC